MNYETDFFDLPAANRQYETARVVVLPIPYERTTSYGRGAAHGPQAILSASSQVEYWEEMTRSEPFRLGIVGAKAVPSDGSPDEVLERVAQAALPHLKSGRFLVGLGGEHTITVGLLQAVRESFGPVGVVQFDAHADLREEYEGSRLSHACIMRRVLDAGHPSVAVGLRAFSSNEQRLIEEREIPVIYGWELNDALSKFDRYLGTLPDTVYLTFDVDYFDPTLMPATGTPVPGGGTWYSTLSLLDLLFRRKRVVAMDLVELAPRKDLHGCDFLAASLIYKCLAFLQRYGD